MNIELASLPLVGNGCEGDVGGVHEEDPVEVQRQPIIAFPDPNTWWVPYLLGRLQVAAEFN